MSDWDELSIIHGKLLGCGNDAVATLWRLVTWARGPKAGPKPGFVTRKQIMAWSGGLRGKKLDAVIEELVDAGKPAYDHGLLDPAEGGGWWIHDFAQRSVRVSQQPSGGQDESGELTGRAKAGQLGGQARAAKQRAFASQATGCLLAKQQAVASQASQDPGFQVGSDLDLEIREIPKENPPPKDLSGQRAGEVCLEDEDFFLKLEVGERAQLVDTDRRLAAQAKPHLWPEVQELARKFAETTGNGRRLSAYDRDSAVQTLVSLLAAFDHERLVAVLPRAVSTPWWREKALRPLSHLSVAVVEQALGLEAEEARRKVERVRRLRPHLVTTKAPDPEVSVAENAASAQAALEALGG